MSESKHGIIYMVISTSGKGYVGQSRKRQILFGFTKSLINVQRLNGSGFSLFDTIK